MTPSQPIPAAYSFVNAFAQFPEMERLMGAFIAPPPRQTSAEYPPVNVWEDEKALYVESELPGYTLENIEITTLGGQLTIAGTRPAPDAQGGGYVRRERAVGPGRFARTMQVGTEFDANKVQATLKHGVLTVVVPKVPAPQARKIEVKGF